ncbi:MAG: gluconate kinase [Frankiales bacterium]|nr:gluconate kinase [Frankiales bacterium]
MSFDGKNGSQPRGPIADQPRIVVMGVSGSGKTTVGLLLAQRLQLPFEDADDLHSEAARAKMAAGQPLTDEDREPWLVRCAQWLAAQKYGGVLACSALKRSYRDLLRTGNDSLCFLHLAGDPAVVAERVAERQHHYMPSSLVPSQYQALEPLQPDELGVAVDFTLGPSAIVDRFLEAGPVRRRS